MERRVSVITRTKDRLLLVKRAIRSVLQQTFSDWTHVIVNDGGNARELDLLLKEFEGQYEGRLEVIHNAESQGMQNASNSGIERVDSEFIVIHDDDDSWHPEFLESCVSFLDEAGPDSVFQGVITHTEKIVEGNRFVRGGERIQPRGVSALFQYQPFSDRL